MQRRVIEDGLRSVGGAGGPDHERDDEQANAQIGHDCSPVLNGVFAGVIERSERPGRSHSPASDIAAMLERNGQAGWVRLPPVAAGPTIDRSGLRTSR